jgi:ATP-dependent exoDNAse (exonuclease V) beta subunit
MNFAVYKSSAGSGKTHTLVKEYIRLVVENPEKYRNILAITFTNKAANEMKSRILLYLKILGQFQVSVEKPLIMDVLEEISAKTGLTEHDISANASLALKLILHNYSNFAVSTIDSFVHRLVRSFARDLRLPVNFEIELDSDKLVTKSIGLLISKVGTDAGLTKALVQFVESKMDDEKSWDIELQLKKFTSSLLKEDSFEAIKKLESLETDDFIRINEKLMAIIKAFENKIQGIAQQADQLIKNRGIDPGAFYYGNKGIPGYFEKLAVINFEKISPNSYVATTIYDNKWYGGKATISDRLAIDEISGQLNSCFTKVQNLVESGFSKYQVCKLVIQNIYPIAVLNAIQKVMDEFRENENIVHISEFNKRIAEIVGSEPVPFIYERIGEKYKHFLVDEFQDTSLLQWQNLLPLLENSLGNNNFNMIVGDGKQAIYRWRNGEVEQFAQLPKIFPPTSDPLIKSREALLTSHYQDFPLGTNYRSKAEIVKFNNDFFKYSRQFLEDSFKNIYESVEQKFVEKNSGGFVRIDFLDKTEFIKDELLEGELEKIRKIIIEDLAGFEHRDIAVLTRKNDEGSEVARYLLLHGINVVSSEVLKLSSSPEVGFLLALLSFINDPKEKLPVGIILNYLTGKKKISFNSLNEAFDGCAELSRTSDLRQNRLPLEELIRKNGINFDISRLKPFTLYENVAELINIFSLDPSHSDPFVQFFMDIILEFTAKFNEGISEFLTFWDDTKHKHSIIVPEGMNAVRIMSIHKAKGLEFPVVIYPFANNISKLAVDDAWIDLNFEEIPEFKTALIRYSKALENTGYSQLYLKEKNKSLLDTLNLLYVTMTRPTKGLFIITRDKTTDKGWSEAPMFKDNADLFRGFLIDKGLWKDDQKIYEFGQIEENSKQQITKEQTSDKTTEIPVNVGNWRKKITISTSAPAVWDVENPNRNREYGNLLHLILSRINSAADLARVLDEALLEGLLDEQQKIDLTGKIGRIIGKPEISKFFHEGVEVKNERDILTPQGKISRPDRVVFDGKKAIILDYKTGHEQEFHLRQLQDYANLLVEMGYPEVEKYLVYLEDEQVVVC